MIPTRLSQALIDQGLLSAQAVRRALQVGGGETCAAVRMPGDAGDYFFKWSESPAVCGAMPAERDSLLLLHQAGAYVPKGVTLVNTEGSSGLLMEYIPRGKWTSGHIEQFAEQLSALYRAPLDLAPVPNHATIGSIPVDHGEGMDLGTWYLHARIQPLLTRCESTLGRDLFEYVRKWVNDQKDALPKAQSWVHGDLWSGNAYPDQHGNVVLIDPVCHHAHPELDLAMMDLFGGFPPEIENTLVANGVVDENWRTRLALWQLIPALVHVAMFGGSYCGIVRRLVTS